MMKLWISGTCVENSLDEPAGNSFLIGDGEMVRLIRSKDWSLTALGPTSGWPQSLRTTVSLCLASNFPINIIWGPEHVQIYNDGYRAVCGEAHPRALGENYTVTWASAWPAIGEPFAGALAGQTSFLENQRMFLTRNGYLEETFFTFSTSPIRAENGDIGGLFHPVTETTATMLSERRTRMLRDVATAGEAAESASQLPEVIIQSLRGYAFDLAFLIVYESDASGGYRLAASHSSGASPDQLARLAPALVAAGNAHPQMAVCDVQSIPGLAEMLATGGCGVYEEPPAHVFVLPLAVPGVAEAPLVLVAGASPRLPLDDRYQDFVRLLAASLTGILGSVRALEDERRRAEALAAIDQAKTTFFSNVSHEFRTPLTLLLGPLEDVLSNSGGLPAREHERLQVAHRNALRLLRLVNSLLDFSRVEAGRASASLEPMDLGALTADIASVFRSATERAGLSLDIVVQPLPKPVDIDRELWETILLNLLSNAFKFTFHGGIRVEVRSETDGSGACVAVADTGSGIPLSEIGRLFERFHRVDGAPGRSFEGTGIGLALVKELVNLHGGTVTVESELERGSTFIVHLPFSAQVEPLASSPMSKAPISSGATAFVEEALRWVPETRHNLGARGDNVLDEVGTVLLVDDNSDMRVYVQSLLNAHGVDVVPAANGAEAMEHARRQPPDLVLSDVMMPGMSGFELLAAIRTDTVLQDIPVILLSARAGQEARVEGLAAGADDYLTKPFTARELVARVMANLKLNRARRQAAMAVATSELRLRKIFESSYQLQWLLSADGRVLDVNPTALRSAGVLLDAVAGQPFWQTPWFTHTPGVPERMKGNLQAAGAGTAMQCELALKMPAGQLRHFDFTLRAVSDATGTMATILAEAVDITTRKAAEFALRDAQKMEAVGQLTGGVAHDFNNLLMVVSSGINVLEREFSTDVRTKMLDSMRRAVDRGTNLTRQLLTFSRRKTFAVKAVDLAGQLRDLQTLLDQALNGEGHIQMRIAPDLWSVETDPGELGLAMLNLCVNARDAIGPGGSITVSASNVALGETEGFSETGGCVRLSVIDTGTGMNAETLEHAFEPFFTTKDIGKGSGLGLAQVHGFAQGCGGRVEIDSEVGRGTTVSLLLRRAENAAIVDVPGASQRAPAPAGLLTVLLVEDEEDVAATVTELLSHLGFRAVRAADSRSALDALESGLQPDVVFSDIMMPGGMNGVALAREIRRRRPGLPVLLTSGYANAFRVEVETDGIPLIDKPYSMDTLIKSFKAVLS